MKHIQCKDYLKVADRRHLEMSSFQNALKMDTSNFQYSSSTKEKGDMHIQKRYIQMHVCIVCLEGVGWVS